MKENKGEDRAYTLRIMGKIKNPLEKLKGVWKWNDG